MAVFGDLHYAHTPPGRRTGTYADELHWLIAQAYSVAANSACEAVACTGDLFHRKAATTHAEVVSLIRFLRPLVDAFGPLLVTTGNHDMVGNNVESSLVAQPIAVLESAGVIRRVDLSNQYACFPGVVVRGMAYSNRFDFTANAEPINESAQRQLPMLTLSHHDITRPDAVFRQLVEGRKVRRVMNDTAWAVVNGHLHDARDIEGDDLTKVAQAGSLARTSWSERDLVPSVLVVSFPEGKVAVSRYELACLMTDEAFEPEAVDVSKDDSRLSEFLDLMEANGWREVDAVAILRDFAERSGADRRVVSEAEKWMSESV